MSFDKLGNEIRIGDTVMTARWNRASFYTGIITSLSEYIDGSCGLRLDHGYVHHSGNKVINIDF